MAGDTTSVTTGRHCNPGGGEGRGGRERRGGEGRKELGSLRDGLFTANRIFGDSKNSRHKADSTWVNMDNILLLKTRF